MKISIIGCGGVGGYFGGKLARAGFDVSFIARGEHLRVMQKNGLKIKSILGDFCVQNIKATDKIKEADSPDLILIAVKAWQIKDIREEIRAILKPETMVIPLQNGVMASSELAESIDEKNILGGLCRILSKIEAPGVIRHFGVNPEIVFGEIDKSMTNRLDKIQQIFRHAGIQSNLSLDIEAEVWKKFITICVGGLMAVSRTSYGELRSVKETRGIMVELLDEVYSLSRKAGINIEENYVQKIVSVIDTFPWDSTASLTRDIWEGKPSELDYQNGTVVRLGEKYGVPTPVNRYVYSCLLPGELRVRGVDLKKDIS